MLLFLPVGKPTYLILWGSRLPIPLILKKIKSPVIIVEPPYLSIISGQITHYINSSKNDVSIDFDAYQEWRSYHPASTQTVIDISTPTPTPTPTTISTSFTLSQDNGNSFPHGSDNETSMPRTSIEPVAAEARYPSSFGHIVELITSGQPVPGIKDVPDTLLSGRDSQAATAKRKKPWEQEGRDDRKYLHNGK
jgi:hypothetical protein